MAKSPEIDSAQWVRGSLRQAAAYVRSLATAFLKFFRKRSAKAPLSGA